MLWLLISNVPIISTVYNCTDSNIEPCSCSVGPCNPTSEILKKWLVVGWLTGSLAIRASCWANKDGEAWSRLILLGVKPAKKKKPCMYQALFGISINPLALKFFGQIIIFLWIQLHLRQNIGKCAFHKLFTWMSDL